MSHERNLSNKLSPEKSGWGWKALIITIILSCVFMGIFYLAITNEPDYMPSQKHKAAQQQNSSEMQQMDHMNMQHTASEPKHDHE